MARNISIDDETYNMLVEGKKVLGFKSFNEVIRWLVAFMPQRRLKNTFVLSDVFNSLSRVAFDTEDKNIRVIELRFDREFGFFFVLFDVLEGEVDV